MIALQEDQYKIKKLKAFLIYLSEEEREIINDMTFKLNTMTRRKVSRSEIMRLAIQMLGRMDAKVVFNTLKSM